MEYVHQVMANFNRLLVEGKHGRFGCFYLSENLNQDMDYTFRFQEDQEGDMYDLPQALPEALGHHYNGPLNLYSDQNLCLRFGMDIEGERGQCINPEGFARFLGLLESIPFHDTGSSSSDSFGYAAPDSRYVLKKRFDRGAYGEVWLAFNWNCSQGTDALNWRAKDENCSLKNVHLDPYDNNTNSQTNSPPHDCHTDPQDNNIFILKRIMVSENLRTMESIYNFVLMLEIEHHVEKGTGLYLSGLREKYFGELFLNASVSLGGSLSAGLSDYFSEDDSDDLLESNKSVPHEIGYTWNPENIFLDEFRLQNAVYEEGLNHIARYVESFESRSKEIWLVFHHEGISLSKLIYTAEVENVTDKERGEQVKNVQVLHPSKWWHWLRTTDAGKEEMRDLIWQLVLDGAELGSGWAARGALGSSEMDEGWRGVVDEARGISVIMQAWGTSLERAGAAGRLGTAGAAAGCFTQTHLEKINSDGRIIDFGSAIDEFTVKHLYGSNGPSRSEQTYEYTPPEALLNASWFQEPTGLNLKYDMWSMGVVILELILGSPHVFQINARTRALLDQHLEGWNEDTKELAYK
ncbi:hypothetical protein HHK36_026779 [Tetracentron sinense]|uniref:Protein kinase domain-containing protein n=1 Tax=Tetracentron sinense TaxID=13715 RepID=A0A835D2G3_TETSI|nr:hypothetical protein HHK36_026779 [Tetracentron sinense]